MNTGNSASNNIGLYVLMALSRAAFFTFSEVFGKSGPFLRRHCAVGERSCGKRAQMRNVFLTVFLLVSVFVIRPVADMT